jgi:diguanylate cyclase (GGDEF)-like protein
MVFWYGYLWAAIPAYFSTFMVGYIGGMSLDWLIVFSLANPLSLALYTLSYEVVKLRPGMSNLVSIVSFVTISLVASLAGSVGAFIWAYANKVGLNVAYLVWQGWWVGGWLQAVLIVLPILHIVNPYVERWTSPIKSINKTPKIGNYKAITISTVLFVLVLVGYVSVARFISIKQFDIIQSSLADDAILLNIQNAIDGMSYPLYILLMVMIALTYLIYTAVIYWHQTLLKANQQLLDKNIELEELATTDSLTKLFNRRRALEFAEAEFERSVRNQQHLSILMVDIDKFKRINDELGHLVGDTVIRDVAKRLSESVRPYDVSGRYGGEEFIVILPDTDLDNAIQIAKRILAKIEQTPVNSGKGQVKVTVSIGATSLLVTDVDSNFTIERADQALLKAKSAGRNCIKW